MNGAMFRRIAREEAEYAITSRDLPDEHRIRRMVTAGVEQALSTRTRWAEFHRAARDQAQRTAAEVASTLIDQRDRDLVSSMRGVVAELVPAEVDRLLAARTPALIEVSVNAAGLTPVDGDTHAMLPSLLLAVGAGCHVFLVGPAGTGKSTMAQQAAQALDLPFYALSVGPTTPTSKMFGYLDATGNYHRTPLREAYEHGGLMLLDELDNGHPGLLTELNQALALAVCAFPDGMIARHERFRLVATGNTYGLGADRQYVGRQALDAATLDRLVTLDIDIDERLETRLTMACAPSAVKGARQVLAEVRRLRKRATEKRLPVMFSPRACIHAARLLEAGADRTKAMQWAVFKGLSDAHRAALELPVREGKR